MKYTTLTKAVILAAGEGQRLLPITATRPKHLIHLAGKPLLQYTIEYLRDAGIKEILLIVGYLKEQFYDYFKDGSSFGVKITYKTQISYLGTANAAGLCEEFVGNNPFMLIYGDLLMDAQIFTMTANLYNQQQSAESSNHTIKEKTVKNKTIKEKTIDNKAINGIICLFKVPDPQKYGIIQLDNENNVKTIVEKPEDDRFGNLANAGVYVFNSKIFDCIRKTEKSKRGEYELTDSMQILVNQGDIIKGLDISGFYWSDVGHPWQILDANQHMLGLIESKNEGVIEPNVTIHGVAHIGKNTVIKSGTYIEGPVFIGNDCEIGPQAYIRPNTLIGNKCRIGNSSELKNCVVMDGTYMSHLSYAGDSVIGSNVNFGCGSIISNVRLDKKEIFMKIKDKKVATGKTKLGAVIGDNVQLGINSCIMVGVKIGANSVVGPNTLIDEDVPENSIVYSKTEKIIKTRK